MTDNTVDAAVFHAVIGVAPLKRPTVWQASAPSNAVFHAVIGVAPLKLFFAARVLRGCRVFHAVIGVAPLKPEESPVQKQWHIRLPRCDRRGPIEARNTIILPQRLNHVFHAVISVAPLKPSPTVGQRFTLWRLPRCDQRGRGRPWKGSAPLGRGRPWKGSALFSIYL